MESFIDITDCKRAEESLRRSQEELELRVRELTAQLELAKAKAESANRPRANFSPRGWWNHHGGKVWAERRGEGKGSTFSYTIPRLFL